MFTNGSTAMECGGGAKAAGATPAGAVGDVGDDTWCFEIGLVKGNIGERSESH